MIIIMIKVEGRGRRGGQMGDNAKWVAGLFSHSFYGKDGNERGGEGKNNGV